jgi:hypothetical protein
MAAPGDYPYLQQRFEDAVFHCGEQPRILPAWTTRAKEKSRWCNQNAPRHVMRKRED